jgi:hypothetical protein
MRDLSPARVVGSATSYFLFRLQSKKIQRQIGFD